MLSGGRKGVHRRGCLISSKAPLACGKRSAAELYDVARDPYQLNNLAGHSQYADAQKRLRDDLDRWMRDTDDPLAKGPDDCWDRYPYFGKGPTK